MNMNEWEACNKALEDLHYYANMYKVSLTGKKYLDTNVLNPYLVLNQLLNQVKPKKVELIPLRPVR